jgi:hypothetical protein
MVTKFMTRSCSNCGTEFKESISTRFNIDEIDHIPECWKSGKQNGICIKCCSCS